MIEEIQKDILKAMEVEENFFKIIRPIVESEVRNQLTPLINNYNLLSGLYNNLHNMYEYLKGCFDGHCDSISEVEKNVAALQLEIDGLKLDLNKSRENFRA